MPSQYTLHVDYTQLKENPNINLEIVSRFLRELVRDMNNSSWTIDKESNSQTMTLKFLFNDQYIKETIDMEIENRIIQLKGPFINVLNKIFGKFLKQQIMDVSEKLLKEKIEVKYEQEIEKELSTFKNLKGISIFKGANHLFDNEPSKLKKFKL